MSSNFVDAQQVHQNFNKFHILQPPVQSIDRNHNVVEIVEVNRDTEPNLIYYDQSDQNPEEFKKEKRKSAVHHRARLIINDEKERLLFLKPTNETNKVFSDNQVVIAKLFFDSPVLTVSNSIGDCFCDSLCHASVKKIRLMQLP